MIDTLFTGALCLLLLAELAVHALAAWQLGVAALGLARPRKPIREGTASRFVVVIPAHNEETVIAGAVASLRALDYPAERRTIIVLADRCTDATAARAREAGAEVMERSETAVAAGSVGKPGAVAWLLGELGPRKAQFDALVLIDADNRVDRELLRRFSGHLEGGDQVVQAFTGVLGADASATSLWSSIGFFAINHLGQEPRERLGLSAAVGGTGVAISMPALEAVPWDMRSLTEDLELGAKLALGRIRVAFDPVRIHDEKPRRLEVSVAQRRRWMQGRFDVAGRYFVPLVRAGLERGDIRALDVALCLLSPGLAFAGVFTGGAALLRLVAMMILPWFGLRGAAAIAGAVPPGAALAAAVAYYGSTFIALRAEKVGRAFYRAALTAPFFLLLSVPLAVVGFFGRKDKRWVKTPHGESPPSAQTTPPQ